MALETTDPRSRSEAESLCKELESCKFVVGMVFWHDILFKVNYVSKQLHSESSDIAVAVENLERLSEWMATYRETGLISALVTAQEIAEELEIEPVFPKKRAQKKKRMFQYEAEDEVVPDPQEPFHVNCFNRILDTAISSTDTRSQQLWSIHELFGFLYNF